MISAISDGRAHFRNRWPPHHTENKRFGKNRILRRLWHPSPVVGLANAFTS